MSCDPALIEIEDSSGCPEVIELLIGARGPAGGGTVNEVNGQLGPIVALNAEDVGAIPLNAVISGGTY